MHTGTPSLVADVRSASRELVRQFGFMSRTVAGTDFSVSAVHAIIEIGKADGLSARDLSGRLILEKSTISRLVKALVAKGEIREVRSSDDGRVKALCLTCKGARTLAAIDSHAETQVCDALGQLDEAAQQGVLNGLQDYSAALKAAANSQSRSRPLDRARILSGYTPGLTGRVVDMLIPYMNGFIGFGAAFEARVAADLAEFISRIESPENGIWRAEIDGHIAGSISIDGQDLEDGLAHLRWFIVGGTARGGGIGNALLERALDFCDARGFREVHLWTVKGLDAARRLYERHGLVLVEEYDGDQWGATVTEQKFVRPARM